jgi:hypothetical protein
MEKTWHVGKLFRHTVAMNADDGSMSIAAPQWQECEPLQR